MTDSAWSLSINDTFADGTPVDIWAYRGGAVQDSRVVPFSIKSEGTRVDFNPTAFLATVVSKRLAELWQSIAPAEIQRIPASVDGDLSNWEVVSVLNSIDCIDHKKSKITYFPPNHKEKPGKPRGILKLVLDESRIGNRHIIQPKDWEVVTVVSETVKRAMQDQQITGVGYWCVTS